MAGAGKPLDGAQSVAARPEPQHPRSDDARGGKPGALQRD